MRYNVLDAWRGLACVGMFIFHLEAVRIFVMQTYSTWLFDWPGVLLGQFVRISFLLLVGISTWIIYNKKNGFKSYAEKQAKRFLKVGLAALLVSVVSYLVAPEYYILFGILHLITIANVLMIGLAYIPRVLNVFLGLLVIWFGHINLEYSFGKVGDFLLGQPHEGFKSFDYFALIPWFGYVMVGFGMASVVLSKLAKVKVDDSNVLTLLGKRALGFYIVHLALIFVFWKVVLVSVES